MAGTDGHHHEIGKKTRTAASVAVLLLLCLMARPAHAAQPADTAAAAHDAGPHAASATVRSPERGWFVSPGIGTLLGQGTFRSFGSCDTHFGYALTLSAGYRFSTLLALEVSASAGHTVLTAMDCCRYWLSEDLGRSFVPVIGKKGWDYGELESGVSLRRYSLQLDFNLLGLLPGGGPDLWRAELSPRLSLFSTAATLSGPGSVDGAMLERTCGRQRHLGLGGQLSATRRLTDRFDIGIYTDIDCLTGSRIDRIPVHCHKSNFVFGGGLRLVWNISATTPKRDTAYE